MIRLNVLTTATPRLDLHKKGLIPTIRFLQSLYDVHWYVNLDKPPMMSDEDYLESRAWFEEEMKQDSNVRVHFPMRDPSFKNAARNLIRLCDDYTRKDLFFWLEDDWYLTDPNLFRESIDDFLAPRPTAYPPYYILMSANAEKDHSWYVPTVNGRPHIYRIQHFNMLRKLYIEEGMLRDPELQIFEAKRRLFRDHTHKVPLARTDVVFEPGLFVDIGRDWREEQGIDKVPKKSEKLKTWFVKRQ